MSAQGDGFAIVTPPREMSDADFLTWMASYAEEHQPTGYPCVQTWEITRLVEMHRRLRISQLRRMADAAVILMRSAEETLRLEQHRRHRGWPHRDCGFLRRRYMRWGRFIARMDDEIERLRGEG